MNGLPMAAGTQMDVNYLFQKVVELSEVLRENREKTQSIVGAAEQLAVYKLILSRFLEPLLITYRLALLPMEPAPLFKKQTPSYQVFEQLLIFVPRKLTLRTQPPVSPTLSAAYLRSRTMYASLRTSNKKTLNSLPNGSTKWASSSVVSAIIRSTTNKSRCRLPVITTACFRKRRTLT